MVVVVSLNLSTTRRSKASSRISKTVVSERWWCRKSGGSRDWKKARWGGHGVEDGGAAGALVGGPVGLLAGVGAVGAGGAAGAG